MVAHGVRPTGSGNDQPHTASPSIHHPPRARACWLFAPFISRALISRRGRYFHLLWHGFPQNLVSFLRYSSGLAGCNATHQGPNHFREPRECDVATVDFDDGVSVPGRGGTNSAIAPWLQQRVPQPRPAHPAGPQRSISASRDHTHRLCGHTHCKSQNGKTARERARAGTYF